MIRTITLGAATALLIVGLPVAAMGFSQSLDVDQTPTVTAELVQMELEIQEQFGMLQADAVQAAIQAQTQQRVQEHVATGVPEDEVPVQNRVRGQEQAQISTQAMTSNQARVRAGGSEPLAEPAANGEGNRFGQTEDATRGNAGAQPSADCPNNGECPNDGDCPHS